MEHIRIGQSGLETARLGLGSLTWGRDTEDSDVVRMIAGLLDVGGSAIDLSPAYSGGAALAAAGRALDGGISRDELVLVLHAGVESAGSVPNTGRSSLLRSVESSLATLGTTYADVVMIAAPDPLTPLEETLETAAGLVQSGAARYIGFAHHEAWQSALAVQYLRDHSLPAPVAFGGEYSLLDRSLENGTTSLATHCGTGVFAYAPLAGGVLTGKYRHTIPPTSRAATDHLNWTVSRHLEDGARKVTEAVAKAADGLARTPADVALAWLLMRPAVSTLFVGARTASQFDQLIALDISALPGPVYDVLTEISE